MSTPPDAPFDSQVTFIYTKDLAESAAFYGETLGLPLILDQGRCRIFRVSDTGYLGICTRDDAPRPEGVILTLVTEDVDEWHDRLTAAGVAFESAPAHNPEYRIYHCFLRDPDGYLVEIQRFLDPAWPGAAGGGKS